MRKLSAKKKEKGGLILSGPPGFLKKLQKKVTEDSNSLLSSWPRIWRSGKPPSKSVSKRTFDTNSTSTARPDLYQEDPD